MTDNSGFRLHKIHCVMFGDKLLCLHVCLELSFLFFTCNFVIGQIKDSPVLKYIGLILTKFSIFSFLPKPLAVKAAILFVMMSRRTSARRLRTGACKK